MINAEASTPPVYLYPSSSSNPPGEIFHVNPGDVFPEGWVPSDKLPDFGDPTQDLRPIDFLTGERQDIPNIDPPFIGDYRPQGQPRWQVERDCEALAHLCFIDIDEFKQRFLHLFSPGEWVYTEELLYDLKTFIIASSSDYYNTLSQSDKEWSIIQLDMALRGSLVAPDEFKFLFHSDENVNSYIYFLANTDPYNPHSQQLVVGFIEVGQLKNWYINNRWFQNQHEDWEGTSTSHTYNKTDWDSVFGGMGYFWLDGTLEPTEGNIERYPIKTCSLSIAVIGLAILAYLRGKKMRLW